MHNSSATVTYPVAFGASKGYFQVSRASHASIHALLQCATLFGSKVVDQQHTPGLLSFSGPSIARLLQIDPIDSRPRNMKIACGICSCVGPIMFLVYFAIITMKKKKKV